MRFDSTSRRLLTNSKGVLCGVDGKALTAGQEPVTVYIDLITGKAFARVAQVLPSNPDPQAQAARKALTDLDPVHYDSDNGDERGWYVPAPDFSAPVPAAQ